MWWGHLRWALENGKGLDMRELEGKLRDRHGLALEEERGWGAGGEQLENVKKMLLWRQAMKDLCLGIRMIFDHVKLGDYVVKHEDFTLVAV